MTAAWACTNALFLQGPTGPFFAWMMEELRSQGIHCTKILMNRADEHWFRGEDLVPFRGTRDEWPAFVERLVDERSIDAVFLFGDLRPIHVALVPMLRAKGVRIWVFEEGYLRPDYVTVEEHGVNGNSRLPRDAEFYRRAFRELPAPGPVESVGPTFRDMGWFSTVSALLVTHGNQGYPHYEHHRNFNAWDQTAWWVRGWFRKHWFRFTERHELAQYTGPLARRYWFLPLQVHCDFQVVHSPFASIPEFAETAIREFAALADPSHHLVVKHHPMDRAYCDYSELMAELATKYGLGERLHYVHDVDLPTILDHALGTITMNSTVGIQSLDHGTPVKVLGNAVYDIPGMTFQGSLGEFLRDPGTIDAEVLEGFRRHLRFHNQGNGSIWKRLPSRTTGSGVIWPPAMRVGANATAAIDPAARVAR